MLKFPRTTTVVSLGSLIGALAGATPRPAQATENLGGTPGTQTEASSVRRTAIGLDLGVASAVGVGGVTLTRALGDHARIELGGGIGLSGWQLSLMPQVTFGGARDRFVAGAGLAIAFPTDSRSATGHPIWLNVDAAGYEHRFDSGFAFSAALGLTGGLGGGQLCVPSDGCEPQFLHDVTTYWGPQGRIQLAYWF